MSLLLSICGKESLGYFFVLHGSAVGSGCVWLPSIIFTKEVVPFLEVRFHAKGVDRENPEIWVSSDGSYTHKELSVWKQAGLASQQVQSSGTTHSWAFKWHT